MIHLFPLQHTLLSEVCCIMYWEYQSVAREITTISRCFRDYILTALQDEGWGCGNEDLLMKQGSCVLQALVYTFWLSVKRDERTLQKAKYFTVFLCCIFPFGLWYLTGKHLVYFQLKYRHKVCTDPCTVIHRTLEITTRHPITLRSKPVLYLLPQEYSEVYMRVNCKSNFTYISDRKK